MPPQTRLGDVSNVPVDAHGCPACPHNATGPFIQGSPNVVVNNMPAVRQGDKGVHAACCGPNMHTAGTTHSMTVKINNLPAVRKGDMTTHCGGMGTVKAGSSNVDTGG